VVFRVQSSKVEGGGGRAAGALGTMVPTTMTMFALLNPTLSVPFNVAKRPNQIYLMKSINLLVYQATECA
jgi:hypothetical protein